MIRTQGNSLSAVFQKHRLAFLFGLLMILLLSGCMATRSEIQGSYLQPAEKHFNAEPVNVFLLFKHFSQQKGFDAIPKLAYSDIMKGNAFDNILRDSLKEITNIDKYETFTEVANDVNLPERRERLKTLRANHDYTIEIQILEESSFKQQAFSGLINLISLTVVPMPYSWDYTLTATLYDQKGKLLRSYERRATLDNWVELFLIFAYPFHPIEGKREEIYSGFLHDLFKQIESEKVLNP